MSGGPARNLPAACMKDWMYGCCMCGPRKTSWLGHVSIRVNAVGSDESWSMVMPPQSGSEAWTVATKAAISRRAVSTWAGNARYLTITIELFIGSPNVSCGALTPGSPSRFLMATFLPSKKGDSGNMSGAAAC